MPISHPALRDFLLDADTLETVRPGQFRITVSAGEATDRVFSCCPVVDSTVEDNFSSGVLIASRLVLTARHSAPARCFVRIPAATFLHGPRFDAAQVVRAPQRLDLALLILAEPVPDTITPARLASAADFDLADQRGVTLCGFGFTRDAFNNLAGAGIKRRSKKPVAVSTPGEQPDIEFIAGGVTAGEVHDAEVGDSGGPAYLGTGDSIVIGIVSRNAAGHKSVLTRVDVAGSWIRAEAAKHGISMP